MVSGTILLNLKLLANCSTYFYMTPYPMEAHLVHQNSSGEYAVIGLLIKAGQDNQLMKTVWAQIPETGEVKTVRDISLDVSNFLPANQAYYGYQGSLTTPL